MRKVKLRTSNPEAKKLFQFLDRHAKKTKSKMWKGLVNNLTKPKRSRISVNVGKLFRLTSDGDTVAVPGKILGSGLIKHELIVAAYHFTPQAKIKIEAAGGKCINFYELVKKNPKGSNIKMIK